MRSTLLAAAAVLSLGFSATAFAAGGGANSTSSSQPSKPVDPNFARAKAMIEAKDYNGALPLLQQVVAKDPRNADAYNLMGYATRKCGNANGSLQYYQQALAIDPRHLGAHEYIGEAYLMLDRLPRCRAASRPSRFAVRLRLHRIPHAQDGDRKLQAGQEADELTVRRAAPDLRTAARAVLLASSAAAQTSNPLRHPQWPSCWPDQRMRLSAAERQFAHARMAVAHERWDRRRHRGAWQDHDRIMASAAGAAGTAARWPSRPAFAAARGRSPVITLVGGLGRADVRHDHHRAAQHRRLAQIALATPISRHDSTAAHCPGRQDRTTCPWATRRLEYPSHGTAPMTSST